MLQFANTHTHSPFQSSSNNLLFSRRLAAPRESSFSLSVWLSRNAKHALLADAGRACQSGSKNMLCSTTAMRLPRKTAPPSSLPHSLSQPEPDMKSRLGSKLLAQSKPTAPGQVRGFLLTWNESGAGKLKSTHWSFSKPGAASELNQHVLFLQGLNQPLIKLIRDSGGF